MCDPMNYMMIFLKKSTVCFYYFQRKYIRFKLNFQSFDVYPHKKPSYLISIWGYCILGWKIHQFASICDKTSTISVWLLLVAIWSGVRPFDVGVLSEYVVGSSGIQFFTRLYSGEQLSRTYMHICPLPGPIYWEVGFFFDFFQKFIGGTLTIMTKIVRVPPMNFGKLKKKFFF